MKIPAGIIAADKPKNGQEQRTETSGRNIRTSTDAGLATISDDESPTRPTKKKRATLKAKISKVPTAMPSRAATPPSVPKIKVRKISLPKTAAGN